MINPNDPTNKFLTGRIRVPAKKNFNYLISFYMYNTFKVDYLIHQAIIIYALSHYIHFFKILIHSVYVEIPKKFDFQSKKKVKF